jgi:hypothetical protein
MGRRLRSTVYLTGEDGTTTCLLAGSVPSAAQAARVTNPKAWEDGEAAPPTSAPAAAPEGSLTAFLATSEGQASVQRARDETLAAAHAGPSMRQPPRKGPGSSRAAWAAYAAARGIDIPEGADRDSIISEVDRSDRATPEG